MLKKYLSNIRANSDRNSTARTSQEASEDSPIDGLSEHDNLMDLKDVFSDVDVPPRSGAYNPDDEGENDEAHSTEDQLDSEIDAFLNEIISEIDETSTPVGHSSDDRPSKMSHYIDALDAIDVFDDIPAPEPISDPFMYERLKEALRERDKLQEKIERLER